MKLTPDTQIQWRCATELFLGLGQPEKIIILCWKAIEPIEAIPHNAHIWRNMNNDAIVWTPEDQP